jgi:tRNA threonylcarbamoyladenosine biosynthesis protein TsaB
MLVLVVDTAGSTGGVLLARNESGALNPAKTEVLGAGILQPREFSTQLVSSVAELFHSNQLALSQLDAFAVVSGPGSFTGLRVGLSAVKAMAEVTPKPVIALSRLAIMASMVEPRDTDEGAAGLVHAVLDAGRGEFYHGIYRDAGWTRVAESLQTPTTLTTSFKSNPGIVIACEPVVLDALSDVMPRQIPCVTVHEALPLILAAWQARRFTDVALLDANYLRHLAPHAVLKAAIAPESADARATRS